LDISKHKRDNVIPLLGSIWTRCCLVFLILLPRVNHRS